MSFFRNLRSSLTRGRSTSRDTTPVRNSRPGSVRSSLNSGSSSSKRRDSTESRAESLLNRSDTFILDDPDATPSHSNCSTLEKKLKKSKVLEKFSTFTKRKKNPTNDSAAFEHHPSDNATNTYYKWQADGGGNSLDYDSQNDPFNFLYEQQSSLKSNSSPPSSSFDSSTYRKSKVPADLKKQLKMLKDQDANSPETLHHVEKKVQIVEDEPEEETKEVDDIKAEKYKTVTLNSFRRSFREKFLQQQKEAPHNPAWFVEVVPPELQKTKNDQRDSSKENRRDLFIFKNENYRPESKSPIRDLSGRKELRTRSPVKRNETFKVERLSRLDQQENKTKSQQNNNSIHIEFKNSITPHIPGRMVPVGVAKPMPSQLTYNNYYRKIEPTTNSNYGNKSSTGTSSTRLNNHSPTRSPWLKSQSPNRLINSNPNRMGRYQTLVQIKNEKSQQASPITVRNSRLSTRIKLEAYNPDKKVSTAIQSPSFGKRYYSSQLISNSGCKAVQPLKQTYFGETSQTARISEIPSHLSSSTSGLRTRQTAAPHYGGYKSHTPSIFASTSSLTPASAILSRTTPAHSVNNIHSNANNNLSYSSKHYQQQQQQQQQHPSQQQQQQQHTRFVVTGQRRSRSPIKIPWR